MSHIYLYYICCVELGREFDCTANKFSVVLQIYIIYSIFDSSDIALVSFFS